MCLSVRSEFNARPSDRLKKSVLHIASAPISAKAGFATMQTDATGFLNML